MTGSFGDKCLFFFVFCLAVSSWASYIKNWGYRRAGLGQRGCNTTHPLPWIGMLSLTFFFLTLFLPSVCVFDFVFNLVWLAVNGAWLVFGINDMTRDTPLLEFSQVRATPIDGTPLPLCLPSCWMKASLFLSLFLLFFQLIKEREMDTKELIRGDMKMGEGERGSPGQMRRRAAQPECAFECMSGLRVNIQLWPPARGPLCSGTWRAAVLSRSSIPWRSLGPPAAVLSA